MNSILGSVRLALDTLRLNPLRTALSTLGIIMGAGSLAAVLSLADGTERLAHEAIERQGLSAIYLQPRTERVVDGLRIPEQGYPIFSVEDAAELAAAVGADVSVALGMEGTGMLESSGQRPRAVRIAGTYGLNQRPFRASGNDLESGRLLTTDDMRAGASVAVISFNLAEELSKAGVSGGRVGETIKIGGRDFQVVGVMKPVSGQRIFTAEVPLAASEAAMVPSPAPRARGFHLKADTVDDVERVRDAVTKFAESRTAWGGKFNVAAYGRERLEQASRGFLILKMVMGAFTAISLVVGGIGIMNVLLASILERTREIGIRKAVGARRRDVLRQFLVESMTISLAGTVAGVALGLAASFAFTAIVRAKTQAPMHAAVTWQTLAIAAASAVTIGLLAGVYPAMRASKLTTIDAIQRE
jgi:putative ABC transport system permease protein